MQSVAGIASYKEASRARCCPSPSDTLRATRERARELCHARHIVTPLAEVDSVARTFRSKELHWVSLWCVAVFVW